MRGEITVKERYIVTMMDGSQYNVHCETITKCVQMFGEEEKNIVKIEKLDGEEDK